MVILYSYETNASRSPRESDGGEQMVWEEQGWARDQRQDTLGGDQGTRASNRGVVRTDGRLMPRESQGDEKYQRGRCWGFFPVKCNGAARRRGHNTHAQGLLLCWTRDRLGVRGLGKIRLATLNIMLGRAVGLEAALMAMQQGNVDMGVLQETKLKDRIHA